MSKFEAVLLLSPEITNSIKKNIIDDFSALIKDNSGKIVEVEDWGLRDLTYKIGNFSKAFYSFFQIEIDGSKIESIKKNISQNENCIRHIFIKVSNHQELPTMLNNEKK